MFSSLLIHFFLNDSRERKKLNKLDLNSVFVAAGAGEGAGGS